MLTRRRFLGTSAAFVAAAVLPLPDLPEALRQDETLEVEFRESYDPSHMARVLMVSATWIAVETGEPVTYEWAELVDPGNEELFEERKAYGVKALERAWVKTRA